jgi:hypothetical protein
MIVLVAVAVAGQPSWLPVYPGCSASPCEVAAAPEAIVEFFGTAFKNAAMEAPVTSDGIGTVIKAFRDGMNVVIKVRERDGGALILTQSAAALSPEGAAVTSSRAVSRSSVSTPGSSRPIAKLEWPAFFVSLDPLPDMPAPKVRERGCLVSEIQKAIGFMSDADDLLQRYASLFKRHGFVAEIDKKRAQSLSGKMLYFDVSVSGRSEARTLLFHLTRYNANNRFAARFRVCSN